MGDFGKTLEQLAEYFVVGFHTVAILTLGFIWSLPPEDQKDTWELLLQAENSSWLLALPYLSLSFVLGLTVVGLASEPFYKWFRRIREKKGAARYPAELIALRYPILYDQYNFRVRRGRIMQASTVNFFISTLVIIVAYTGAIKGSLLLLCAVLTAACMYSSYHFFERAYALRGHANDLIDNNPSS